VPELNSQGPDHLIFVSHSGQDTWVAKQIAREIEMCGAKPFLDEAEIDAGADFEEDIRKFLERADELIVLLRPGRLSVRTSGLNLVRLGAAGFQLSHSYPGSRLASYKVAQEFQ
jgi:TIR domain